MCVLQAKVEEAQEKYGDPPPAPPVMQKIFRIPMEKMFAVMPKMRVLMADADFKVFNFGESSNSLTSVTNQVISGSGTALIDPNNLQVVAIVVLIVMIVLVIMEIAILVLVIRLFYYHGDRDDDENQWKSILSKRKPPSGSCG